MTQFKKTLGNKNLFFVPFLFLTLTIFLASCSTITVEEELGIDENDERQETYLIDKEEVVPPGDRD